MSGLRMTSNDSLDLEEETLGVVYAIFIIQRGLPITPINQCVMYRLASYHPLRSFFSFLSKKKTKTKTSKTISSRPDAVAENESALEASLLKG